MAVAAAAVVTTSVASPAGGRSARHRGGRRRLLVVAAAVLVVVAGVAVTRVVATRGDDADETWFAVQFADSDPLSSDDETVCSRTLDDVLYCVDGADGDERFTQQLEYAGALTTTITDGTLLAANTSGTCTYLSRRLTSA